MAEIPPGKKKPQPIPSLYIQVLFVALAFFLMVVSSSSYVSNMLRDSLRRESRDLLDRTRLKIEIALAESENTLVAVSRSIRHMILHGADENDIRAFMEDITSILQTKPSKLRLCCIYGYFDVFGGIYIHALQWEPPEGHNPRERPWFKTAKEAGDRVAVTPVYKDLRKNESIVTFVHRFFDDEGQPMGIIAIDLPLYRIINYIADMRLTPGSYGIFFDENMIIYFHPNPEIVGLSAHEMGHDLAQLAEEVLSGNNLFERTARNYRGQVSVFFSELLDNGWILYIVTPRIEYYQTLRSMLLMLSSLGIVLAGALIGVLIHVDKARKKSRAESLNKDILLATMEKEKEMDGRTRLMLDAMPLCCILWDMNLNIVSCNEETVRLFKLSSKDEFTSNFYNFSPEFQPDGTRSRNTANEKFMVAFEEGYVRFEWQHQTKEGEILPCEVTLVRVKHMDEYILVAYTRNLTELKTTLDEMRKVEQDLRLAHKAAESANKAKSAFLANMSHEIRTPMNSIVGFSELALDDYIPTNTRNYLNHIQESAKDLLQIINDILDISKIESGKMEMERIPFDLHEILARCQRAILPKAKEKGIAVLFSAEPSVGKLLVGDPTRLRQVLLNFLSNAVKFTNSGTVKVSVTIVKSDENTIDMRFEVEDSGIGMTPEQITQIYEPFIQADSGTTRKYGGTGLGLTIAKNMIELMGGELIVKSVLEGGSKFSFTLRFGMENIPSGGSAGKSLFDELEKPIFDGEILICEDNTMNQQVIHDHLARVGLRTIIASNGQEAVNIVCKRIEKGKKPSDLTFEKGMRPFDLIFMDIHMPVMDGLEAASKISALGLETPIVAMTANIMASDRELYHAMGIHDCVGKPFTSQELWRCLLKFLSPVGQKTVSKSSQAEADTQLEKILRTHFLKQYKTKFIEIVEAIEMDDIKLAHRLVHTLRSNAAQLGKQNLHRIAREIEEKLKEGKEPVTEKQLGFLEAELKIVLEEFALMPDETDESPPSSNISTEEALELARQIEPLLKSGNPECLTFISRIRAIQGSEKLIRQMEEFDFESALSTLTELKKGWA